MLESRLFHDDSDIDLMRELIRSLPRPTTITDFDETLKLSGVRACTRLWFEDGLLAGFALVDAYNNLCMDCAEYDCGKASVGWKPAIELRSVSSDDVTWAILPYVDGQYGK